MDFRRFTLLVLIGLVSMMLWNAWQQENHPPSLPKASAQVDALSIAQDSQTSEVFPTIESNSNETPVNVSSSQTTNKEQLIYVQTDVLNVAINLNGGNLVEASLPAYPVSLDQPNEPIVLFNNNPKTRYVAQSGLVGKEGPDENKTVQYHSQNTRYVLNEGQDALTVDLHWINPQGIQFTKSYSFKRGQYDVVTSYKIDNKSDQIWSGHFINQILRKSLSSDSKGFFNINAYVGASISTQKTPYEKITFDDMKKGAVQKNSLGGWIAMQQHYFLSAFIPAQNEENLFYSKVHQDDMFAIGVASPKFTVAPGETKTVSAQLYVGPEIPENLKKLAPHLDLTVDYGWLWFISGMLFWLLDYIHDVIGNWGWSIIVLTCLIKLAFYHLSATSYRSMANMRKVQPKLLALKERYGDDRQKMTQATMELYKTEKINPLGGCLPILVQIPVFIALYWVLVESVELRQAPFIFWIKDLSVKDPYYVLPLLMGITMFIQQKLNPPPPDPTQAKVMMLLPVIFTVLFSGFPSGLVLYWVVNNTLSILQQWYIMQRYQDPVKKKRLAFSKK